MSVSTTCSGRVSGNQTIRATDVGGADDAGDARDAGDTGSSIGRRKRKRERIGSGFRRHGLIGWETCWGCRGILQMVGSVEVEEDAGESEQRHEQLGRRRQVEAAQCNDRTEDAARGHQLLNGVQWPALHGLLVQRRRRRRRHRRHRRRRLAPIDQPARRRAQCRRRRRSRRIRGGVVVVAHFAAAGAGGRVRRRSRFAGGVDRRQLAVLDAGQRRRRRSRGQRRQVRPRRRARRLVQSLTLGHCLRRRPQ